METTENTNATYHGITQIVCLECGYVSTNVDEMELWNDLYGECPKNDCKVNVISTNLNGNQTHVMWVYDENGRHVDDLFTELPNKSKQVRN